MVLVLALATLCRASLVGLIRGHGLRVWSAQRRCQRTSDAGVPVATAYLDVVKLPEGDAGNIFVLDCESCLAAHDLEVSW